MTFKQAKKQLNLMGLSLCKTAHENEYRVNYQNATTDLSAYYTNGLLDAVNTGRQMAHFRNMRSNWNG